MIATDTICIRPDGKHCEHVEKDHLDDKPHPFAVQHSWGCVKCWLDDNCPILGPYVHTYNPHILTEAGWLAVR